MSEFLFNPREFQGPSPGKVAAEAVADWRARMGTTAAKALYVFRCQSAEWVNAIFRNRGLYQMPVRGQPKCRTVAMIQAITHNLLQAVKLRAEVAMYPN